jgi:ATP-dependent DNA ligase
VGRLPRTAPQNRWDGNAWFAQRQAASRSLSGLVAAALEALPHDCTLDGEILALSEGRPDFLMLLERSGGAADRDVCFVAFDVLSIERRQISELPYEQRRDELVALVPGSGRITATIGTIDVEVAERWLERSPELHLEGVVAKRRDEPYRPGRRSWVKVKHWETADLVVGGFSGALPGPISLLLGSYDAEGRLVYVGRTGALRPDKTKALGAVLQELSCELSFNGGPTPGLSRWDSHRFEQWSPLRPHLVCEVSFTRLDHTFLRHSARFVRWRPDKDPVDCTLARLEPLRSKSSP